MDAKATKTVRTTFHCKTLSTLALPDGFILLHPAMALQRRTHLALRRRAGLAAPCLRLALDLAAPSRHSALGVEAPYHPIQESVRLPSQNPTPPR
ncbi:hypothetical protein GUJ93_ZPchr0004g38389 [Zizania palustris]|uniref:Uncharacterized protein n=1 Tax=Zizania palustris TaxID=103762 RepID=A0A8J5V9E3_ZIZPA|nr:hypothetical protein GUJ93_ZPchr0004g38389 [Zizania palustris]